MEKVLAENNGMHHGRHGLRSEVMEEIVSGNPGFLIDWGNLILASILVVAGGALWFIRYPDIIKAEAKLSSINAPKEVINLVDGKLVELRVREGEQVEKGQLLGTLESLAAKDDVFKVWSMLEGINQDLESGKLREIQDLTFENNLQLGELQNANQRFTDAYLEFKNYMPNGYHHRRLALIKDDLKGIIELRFALLHERELLERDALLSESIFEVNKSLRADKVISDFDFKQEESRLLAKKLQLPRIEASLLNNSVLQNEKRKEIIGLENSIEQQTYTFQQLLNSYVNEIEEWKKKYLLTAPIAGKLNFARFLQENNYVKANETICFINPEESKYYAELVIPQSNFGKVRTGQSVLLKFRSFPYQEFGPVLGQVTFVSDIPVEGGYLARVDLTDGLMTTYQIPIQYRNGLIADAEIITKDRRLFERFFSSLKL